MDVSSRNRDTVTLLLVLYTITILYIQHVNGQQIGNSSGNVVRVVNSEILSANGKKMKFSDPRGILKNGTNIIYYNNNIKANVHASVHVSANHVHYDTKKNPLGPDGQINVSVTTSNPDIQALREIVTGVLIRLRRPPDRRKIDEEIDRGILYED
ncbi:unnamed protein product [Gordionus sp. m RMFG-2023]